MSFVFLKANIWNYAETIKKQGVNLLNLMNIVLKMLKLNIINLWDYILLEKSKNQKKFVRKLLKMILSTNLLIRF